MEEVLFDIILFDTLCFNFGELSPYGDFVSESKDVIIVQVQL
jgi:hypothetical protein